MTASGGRLPPHVALRVATAIQDIEAILVGGQAANFWADYYSPVVPQLSQYGPYTSKDVDFFGRKAAAQQLAAILGGIARFPDFDRHTPNSALVEAEVDGFPVRIDFLNSILGVDWKDLNRAVRLELRAEGVAETQSFSLVVMHPIQCLISRIVNFYHPATRRRDDFAVRQAQACHWIVQQYISDTIDDGDTSEAHHCFNRLHHFLLRHEYTGTIHRDFQFDPLDILEGFMVHPGLHPAYATHTLAKMIKRIKGRRRRLENITPRRAIGGPPCL